MKVSDFRETNYVLGQNIDYPDSGLRICKTYDPDDRVVILWKLSFYERLLVLFTGKVWQQSLLYGHELQDTAITIEKPSMGRIKE